jgi:glutaredoxin
MTKGRLTLVLILLLVGSIFTRGFTVNPLKSTGSDKAEEIAKDFIDKNLMVGQEDGYEIKEIVEENGLYKLTVDIQGNEIISYMTKNASTFFPSAMDMTGEKGEAEQTAQEPEEIPQSDNPTVQLYTMSFCPYGTQAMETMQPVVELLGDAVDIEPHYIFYDNYQGGGSDYCLDEESKYCAMHGINEANQNIRELCVYNNQNDKYWDFVLEVIDSCNSEDIEECWETAAQSAGINVSSVKGCFEENKLAYAADEVDLTTEFNVSGSPTLLINGARFSGDRTPDAYKEAICGAFNEAPEACETELEGAGDTAGASVDASCN